ncbi:hypothetical protein RND81_13G033500 [Saponaria officinalis]|uniref:Uncharacterized protein n=1 Tax=Saponaria officinalis TaxID=3572 RepID=A0AAW1GWL1_SAPOF
MFLFPKYASSRRVISNEDDNTINNNSDSSNNNKCNVNIINKENNNSKETCKILTVWRKSLVVNCSGFTVIDSEGKLVYRVDNYGIKPSEIVLMDGSGESILTLRRHKTLRLVDDWAIYNGEASNKKQPIISYVKKNINLLLQTNNSNNILANVFMGKSCKRPTYVIEGSYGQRSCKVVDKSLKTIMAEIKRKEAKNGSASFGLDVFQLLVLPGFDPGFAMALVLLIDQMYS